MGYTIKWHNSDVIVSYHDNLTYKDLYESDNKLYGDSRFDATNYQVFDFSNIEKVLLTPKEVKVIGALDSSASRWNNKINLVIITDNPKLIDLVKMYEEMVKDTNWTISIYPNLSEAVKELLALNNF